MEGYSVFWIPFLFGISNNINIFDFVDRININKAFWFLKSGLRRQDRRIFIYLVCVGIATIIWFLNALSKNYTVDLDFSVRYTNLPKNKILVNELPKEFTLHVNSFGFTLLRHKLKLSFSPLVFNVNEFTRNMMETTEQSGYTILTSQYLDEIADQLSNELNVLSITPDTLHFNFDHIVQKNVKVYPHVQIELKKQYQLSGPIRTKPDSITVYGPKSILDTLKQVSTEYQYFKSVSEAIQRNISLVEYDNIKFENQRIVLSIPIEEYTESQLLIPVSIINKPDSINLKLFPNRVKVTYLVGLSRYSEILPGDFKLSVTWNEINPEDSRLKIEILALPPFVKSVKIIPEEVEYLIEK